MELPGSASIAQGDQIWEPRLVDGYGLVSGFCRIRCLFMGRFVRLESHQPLCCGLLSVPAPEIGGLLGVNRP